jgi:hypothetical protein
MLCFIWKNIEFNDWFSKEKIIEYAWLIESTDWLVHAKILVPYPLNMFEVGGPNPKGGGGVVFFPLPQKFSMVFHWSGKVFFKNWRSANTSPRLC